MASFLARSRRTRRCTSCLADRASTSVLPLDVVAAFMRAAYGKGYCDALTEDNPGSLCADHGYRIPQRKLSPADA